MLEGAARKGGLRGHRGNTHLSKVLDDVLLALLGLTERQRVVLRAPGMVQVICRYGAGGDWQGLLGTKRRARAWGAAATAMAVMVATAARVGKRRG